MLSCQLDVTVRGLSTFLLVQRLIAKNRQLMDLQDEIDLGHSGIRPIDIAFAG